MVFHPDISSHKVGRPAVRHPDDSALLRRREVLVHHVVAPAFIKGQIGRGFVLEGLEPAAPAIHVDPRFIRPAHSRPRLSCGSSRKASSISSSWCSACWIRYGTFADVDPEDGLEQVRKPLERDILVGTEVRGERHDVGPEGYRSIHFIGDLQQWQQEHFNCIWKWPVTIAMTGSGMSSPASRRRLSQPPCPAVCRTRKRQSQDTSTPSRSHSRTAAACCPDAPSARRSSGRKAFVEIAY